MLASMPSASRASASRYQLLVVIGPGRPRQREQALALGKAAGCVGARVDEDVAVIERGEQSDVTRQQHAIAEYIAAHVADAYHTEILRLAVDAQ